MARKRRKRDDLAGQMTLDQATGGFDPNVIQRCSRCGRKIRSKQARTAGMGHRCQKYARR